MTANYYEMLADALVGDAPESELSQLLSESYDLEHDTSQMSYLFRMEQFFDDNDVYAFDGWEDGVVYGEPEIDKFWFRANLLFPDNLDVDGAKRIIGKDKVNRVAVKRVSDGRYLVRVKILRSVLDDIERENRRLSAREARLVGEPKNADGEPVLGSPDQVESPEFDGGEAF